LIVFPDPSLSPKTVTAVAATPKTSARAFVSAVLLSADSRTVVLAFVVIVIKPMNSSVGCGVVVGGPVVGGGGVVVESGGIGGIVTAESTVPGSERTGVGSSASITVTVMPAAANDV
jgi:hypothetical protein